MDEDKLTDIIAILMKEERNDLIEYIKNFIEMCECCASETESEGEEEEIDVNVDEQGFYSLN
jgi:hypothetical protein